MEFLNRKNTFLDIPLLLFLPSFSSFTKSRCRANMKKGEVDSSASTPSSTVQQRQGQQEKECIYKKGNKEKKVYIGLQPSNLSTTLGSYTYRTGKARQPIYTVYIYVKPIQLFIFIQLVSCRFLCVLHIYTYLYCRHGESIAINGLRIDYPHETLNEEEAAQKEKIDRIYRRSYYIARERDSKQLYTHQQQQPFGKRHETRYIYIYRASQCQARRIVKKRKKKEQQHIDEIDSKGSERERERSNLYYTKARTSLLISMDQAITQILYTLSPSSPLS